MKTPCQIVVKLLQKSQNTYVCILICGGLGFGCVNCTITNPDMGNTFREVTPKRISSVLGHSPAKIRLSVLGAWRKNEHFREE